MKLNRRQLRKRCEQSIESILIEDILDTGGEVYDLRTGSYLGYRQYGSPVLAVAHLDYVNVPHRWRFDRARTRIYTPRLDDRLGVYTILDHLPSIGIQCDILLTTDEEIGQTTASEFADCFPDHPPYRWIVEFDRRGEDVVTYDLDSPNWLQSLERSHFNLGRGSFSDISALEFGANQVELPCMVNIGVGYHHEHSTECYVELSQWKRQLTRFSHFWEHNSETEYVQETPEVEIPSWPACKPELRNPWWDKHQGIKSCNRCFLPLNHWESQLCDQCEWEGETGNE